MAAKAPYGKLNIAVAGLGRMGKRHVKTTYRVPHANLVAVCSLDDKELAWAREFFGKDGPIRVFDSYDKMRESINNEVQPEYWERFEDAFATEANEFCERVLEDKPVPLPLELGLKSLEIGWALQEALLSGKTVHFDQNGKRLDGGERAAKL